MVKDLTDCIGKDLTILVAIDRLNCDRLYPKIRFRDRSHEHEPIPLLLKSLICHTRSNSEMPQNRITGIGS
jgi:hypothetical protein